MKIDPQKTVFLIDGSAFLYRAYYGLRPLHTKNGMPVQAVYGFCRMIQKLIKKFNPQCIALVWDSKGKTTRHEVYEDYKATRQAPPSDLFEQKKLIVKFADLIDLHQIEQKGIEADDIIYSIAKEWCKKGNNAVMVTSDKDMGQAISDCIVMYDPMKDLLLDEKTFEEKNGFPVAKLPFYFSLLGDASDNIPGVRGVGKKGAAELVAQFESLEDVYKNIERVKKPRTKKALLEYKDNAFLSRQLFLLQYHTSGVTKKELEFSIDNWAQARPLFEELNFKSLLAELPQVGKQQTLFGSAARQVEPQKNLGQKYNFICVTTKEQLSLVAAELTKHKAFALDTETDGLNSLQANMIGLSVCVKEGVSYYIPFGHQVDEAQLTKEEVFADLQPILEDKTYAKYLHNAKFDWLVLQHAGINLQGVTFDTIIAARLAVKDWQRLGLKKLSESLFNEPMLNFKEVVTANKYKNFSYVPLALSSEYAAADAHQTLKLYKHFCKELKEQKLTELFELLEMPLLPVLCAMELQGIEVNTIILSALNTKVTKEIVDTQDEILTLIGKKHIDINLNSPKQIEQLLFIDLKLSPQKKSAKKTGYSTDQEVLKALSDKHPVPRLLIKYRELTKLKNTYIDALPKYINPETKHIHTSYSQTAVATGRLASSDPNLQNIPTDTYGYGLQIRAAFRPEKGNIFISADYSQIELRVLAHLSKDKVLTTAFLQKHDIHTETAARLFDEKLGDVTHNQRQIGKRINFSILYGLTPYGLSKDLGITLKEAKQYIEKYFAQYPKVSDWMESIVEHAKEHGYVQTVWGRKRYVSAIYEKNPNLFKEAKRIAINTVAQGTAADIMKQGMINLHTAFAKQKLDAQIILQIHDELLIQVPKEHAQKAEKLTIQILESVVDWSVPLVVTTRIGADWKEVTK